VTDRDACAELLARYAIAIDERDWEGVAACFVEDGAVDFGALAGGETVGAEAVAGVIRVALEGFDATQHLIGTILVRFDGDRAASSSRLQAAHVKDGASVFVGGTYSDRLVRTAEGWRIEHRTLATTWVSGERSLLGL
jgi:3-phenylpropionate/cinnamic acid dioxygenase small subunit